MPQSGLRLVDFATHRGRIDFPSAVSIPTPLIVLGLRKFTPRRLAIVLFTLLKTEKIGGAARITHREFAYVANCTNEEGMSRELAVLLRQGVIRRIGFGKNAQYEVVLENVSSLPDRTASSEVHA